MEISEKELEDLIFNTDNRKLNERGLKIYGKKKRQLNIGAYGIADLVTCAILNKKDGNPLLYIQVIELKKDYIDYKAFSQAIRYIKGILHYFEERGIRKFTFELVLIGKNIDLINESFSYLPSVIGSGLVIEKGISNISFYEYSFDSDGLHFNNKSYYSLTNPKFNING